MVVSLGNLSTFETWVVNTEMLAVPNQEQTQYVGLIFLHSQWDKKAFCTSGSGADKECGKNVYEEADKSSLAPVHPHLAAVMSFGLYP